VLIGNYSVLSKDPGRSIGGGSIGLGMNRGDFNKTSMSRGVFNGVNWEAKSGIPDGYAHPYNWVIPQSSGGMASRNIIIGSGGITSAAMAMGINAQAGLSGSGSVTSATLQLIVSMLADISGSGSITSADLRAFLNMLADLSGSGNAAGTMSALAWLSGGLEGDGAIGATITALGTLSADIRGYGDLTPEGLRDAIWNAAAASYNAVGSIGEKVNDAGSDSNPWNEVIESGFTAAQILRILAAHAAGAATGLEGANPQFTGLDGTTVRIDGSYSAGTRVIDALDGD